MMGTLKVIQKATVLLMFASLAACGDTSVLTAMSSEEPVAAEDAEQLGELPDTERPDETSPETAKPYCSNLSFSGVTWNKTLTPFERRSLSIGLSLSGSFEGPNGWRNLTNNFDGMGLSAGLLNQTLGTGSLQPLLANLKTRNPEALQVLATSRRDLLLAMVNRWQSAKGYRVPSLSSKLMPQEDPVVTSSHLDIPDATIDGELSQKLGVTATAESDSVNWATGNLYLSSGSFKTEWRTELANLMGHPAYVSEQIGAAEVIHRRAAGYVARMGMSSLRAYLFMFDVCVQNGGINDSEFAEIAAIVKNERLTSETTILKRLLEIRLRRTLSQWRADVRSRKTAIIDGIGTVHGSSRNFPKQYCYAQLDPIR